MTVLLPAITETDLTKINLCIQQLGAGRSNAVGIVTLALSSTTTVVTTRTGLCAPGSVPITVPTNAAAAAEVAAGGFYVSAVGLNTFTLTHASNTNVRTFNWAIVG